MRRYFSVRVAVPLLVCVSLMASAQTSKPPRTVLTEKDAYLLLPSELVVGPGARRFALSDDGRHLVVHRERYRFVEQPPAEPETEISLVYWEPRNRVSVTMWKANKHKHDSLADMAFLPQTDTAFALVRQTVPPAMPGGQPRPRTLLLRITPQLDRAQEMDLTEGSDSFHLHVSPTQPLALLLHYHLVPKRTPNGEEDQTIQAVFHVLRRSGRPGPPIPVPADVRVFGEIAWQSDSAPLVQGFRSPEPGEKVKTIYFAVDTQQNRLIQLNKEPELYRGAEAPYRAQAARLPIRVKPSQVSVQEGETGENVRLLWLESVTKTEHPRAFLAADATEPILLPRAEGILYRQQESLFFTPLLRIDKATWELARRAADQTVAISNAKQLGLGLMMYAQDYDEFFPPGDNVNEVVSPYIKNESIFKGFVYTFTGGNLKDIANPAETVLGYVRGPGGNAMIYGDGHVKWVPGNALP